MREEQRMEKNPSKKSTGFQEKPSTPCMETAIQEMSPQKVNSPESMIVNENAKNGDIMASIER